GVLSRASGGGAQGTCGSWFTVAASDWDHRGLVVHDGEASIDRSRPAANTGEWNAFEGGSPRRANEYPSRFGGGVGNRARARVAQSQPAPGRRVPGGRRPQNRNQGSRRSKARTDQIG